MSKTKGDKINKRMISVGVFTGKFTCGRINNSKSKKHFFLQVCIMPKKEKVSSKAVFIKKGS